MRRFQILGVCLVIALSANETRGDNTIQWDSGSPKPVCSGAIYISGTCSLDCGWSVQCCTATARVWQDGMCVKTYPVTVCGGTWSNTLSGLTSCTTYNVTVEIAVTNGCDAQIIITAPATATPN
jgi:hypothetical protein